MLRVRENDLGFWRELALKTALHPGREKNDRMVERLLRISCLAKEITERRPVPLWLKNEMRYADVREIGMGGLCFSPLRRIRVIPRPDTPRKSAKAPPTPR